MRDQKNIRLLEEYVANYPEGQFVAPALLDLANGYEASDRNAKAVETLTTLIEKRPHSPQYAEALLLKAEILERNFPNNRDEACRTYMLLERAGSQDFLPTAYMGIARTVSDPALSAQYARKARNSGGLSAEEAGEAALIEADAHLKQGNDGEAIAVYRELAATPSAIAGAKAAVELGQYYLNKRKYKEAEEVLTDFTDQGTPHQYWLARGFIALADAYKGQGKTALAKEYLTGLRSNYPGKEKDILNMISTRLATWK